MKHILTGIILEEGNWENGTFEGGILRYEYKRPVE